VVYAGLRVKLKIYMFGFRNKLAHIDEQSESDYDPHSSLAPRRDLVVVVASVPVGRYDLAGCGKGGFGSTLGVLLVTQNHHPRPFLRSWGNCARFIFRAFLPKRLFPQPVRS
jgi:hypothetical protein